jgi:hypothetical protein
MIEVANRVLSLLELVAEGQDPHDIRVTAQEIQTMMGGRNLGRPAKRFYAMVHAVEDGLLGVDEVTEHFRRRVALIQPTGPDVRDALMAGLHVPPMSPTAARRWHHVTHS